MHNFQIVDIQTKQAIRPSSGQPLASNLSSVNNPKLSTNKTLNQTVQTKLNSTFRA